MIKVTCAIIENNNKALVVQRSENMNLPEKWEFPGGKIERGETEQDCIIREIKEELNIDIELIQRLKPTTFHYPNQSIQLIPFTAKYTGGNLELTEHKSFMWLTKRELLHLDWAEADIPIVKEYINL